MIQQQSQSSCDGNTVIDTTINEQAPDTSMPDGQIATTLKLTNVFKSVFAQIKLDDELNLEHVTKIINGQLYASNLPLKEYKNMIGFDNALRCRIYDERARRAKKQYTTSSLPVDSDYKENNDQLQLVLVGGSSSVSSVQVTVGKITSKTAKTVRKNKVQLRFELEHLTQQNIKLKQQLDEASMTNASLPSKQLEVEDHRRREVKKLHKQQCKLIKSLFRKTEEALTKAFKSILTFQTSNQQTLDESCQSSQSSQYEDSEDSSQINEQATSQQSTSPQHSQLIAQIQPLQQTLQVINVPYVGSLISEIGFQQTKNIAARNNSNECQLTYDVAQKQLPMGYLTPPTTKQLEEVKQSKVAVVSTEEEITALGCKIKRASLSRLKKGRFINDDIINFMLNIMVKSIPTEQLRKKVILEDTFLYSYMISHGHSDFAMYRKIKMKLPKNKSDCCYYIVPIYDPQRGDHCSLAIFGNIYSTMQQTETQIEVDKGAFCLYLDSYQNATDEVYDCLQRIGRLINQVLGVVSETYLPFYCSRLNIPKQNNSYDCGIFLLEYAARFLRDPNSLILEPSVMIYPGYKFQQYEEYIIWDKFEGHSKVSKRLLDEICNRDQRESYWFDGNITKERRNNIIHFISRIADVESLTDDLVIDMFNTSYIV